LQISVGEHNAQAHVDLDVMEDPAPTQLLMAPNPLPPQHSGVTMGGDPVWNNALNGAGTVAFFVDQGSAIQIEGYACANHGISANHVFYDPGGGTAISNAYANCMTLAWRKGPSANIWQDVAGGLINTSGIMAPLQVRGLGAIRGAKQPQTGDRLSKYGWRTRLTSGLDLGIVGVELDHQNYPGVLFPVRRVSGLFANVGDSGSAILTADRKLVGMVIAGKGIENETYYMQAVPAGQTPPDPMLSNFTISGL
jgi:hypothetical protein